MESRAVSQCPDVHNFKATQAILEVLEADVVRIHHLRLMTTATEILTHNLSLFYTETRLRGPVTFYLTSNQWLTGGRLGPKVHIPLVRPRERSLQYWNRTEDPGFF